jgi:hypothetical protein
MLCWPCTGLRGSERAHANLHSCMHTRTHAQVYDNLRKAMNDMHRPGQHLVYPGHCAADQDCRALDPAAVCDALAGRRF